MEVRRRHSRNLSPMLHPRRLPQLASRSSLVAIQVLRRVEQSPQDTAGTRLRQQRRRFTSFQSCNHDRGSDHCERLPSAKRHLNAREDGEATAQTFV